MSEKKDPKKQSSAPKKPELWIAPKSNLKGALGERAWNDRAFVPTGSRLLELADIALGHKKPEPLRKRRHFTAAAGHGDKH